jgi:hypothetical protein
VCFASPAAVGFVAEAAAASPTVAESGDGWVVAVQTCFRYGGVVAAVVGIVGIVTVLVPAPIVAWVLLDGK